MSDLVLDRVAAAFAAEPGRPALTFYDDQTGERVELSWTTTANWVAKCANLLVDELDVEPGDRVALDLPLHWLTLVLALAGWQVGALVAVGPATAEHARARFAAPDGVAQPGEEHVVLSLAPMAAPVRGDLPAGAIDLARVVPGQPDAFLAFVDVDPTQPALTDSERTLGQVGLTAGLTGGRLLAADGPGTADSFTVLVGALLGGSGLVLLRHGPGDLAGLAATERCTATTGCNVDGLPRL